MKIIAFLALLGLGVLPARATGLEQLKGFLAATQSARGSFVQTVTTRSGRKPQHSSGIFAFQRPGKFRWSYESPYPQLLVSDGARFWSYDPDLKQVAVKKLGDAFGASPAALLAGRDLEKHFALKDDGAADGVEFVEALPRGSETTFTRVRIGLTGNQPRVMEIHDSFGQATLLRFISFEANPALPAATFTFSTPKGADVIGE